MNQIGLKVLSSYEVGKLMGKKQSKGDQIVEGNLIKERLKGYLKQEVKEKLADGTDVTYTVQDMIICATIGDAIEKPSPEKMLTLLKIIGEVDNNTNITLHQSKVDEDLERRAIGQ